MNERTATSLSLPETLSAELRDVAARIAQAGAEFAARGWTPATSSNFSMRLGARHVAITISGRDKGALTADDVMVVDLDGHAVGNGMHPSAETALHTQIYRRFPETGAVLHTHSHNQTVASRLFAADGSIVLCGWELQKAVTGYTRHDTTLEIPVFANSQDMRDLTACVEAWLDAGKPLRAYLIEGHGLYTWGRDMAEAKRHLEALEFLLACELDIKRLGGVP